MGEWDREPMEAPSLFLRLKSKGEQCRIRIASAPYRELKIWYAEQNVAPMKAEAVAMLSPGQWSTVMREPMYNVTEVFHFVVIDRADGQAKIFTTTGGVYGKMRDFAKNPEWGNPRSYDLTIKRTEAPGKNYYEVVPSPNKSELSAPELEKVDAIKIADKLPAALPASSPQPDDLDPNVAPEDLPGQSSQTLQQAKRDQAQEYTPEQIPIEAYNDPQPDELPEGL